MSVENIKTHTSTQIIHVHTHTHNLLLCLIFYLYGWPFFSYCFFMFVNLRIYPMSERKRKKGMKREATEQSTNDASQCLFRCQTKGTNHFFSIKKIIIGESKLLLLLLLFNCLLSLLCYDLLNYWRIETATTATKMKKKIPNVYSENDIYLNLDYTILSVHHVHRPRLRQTNTGSLLYIQKEYTCKQIENWNAWLFPQFILWNIEKKMWC